MKKIIQLFVIAICCTASTCKKKEDGHKYITIINNSDEEIVCQMRWQGVIKPGDTLYECRTSMWFFKDDVCKIESKYVWEDDFTIIPYVQFFIVKDSIYRNIPCDTISKYNMVLHRYQLTLNDLQRLDWIVNYPPKFE